MRLRTIRIQNFRSIGDLTLDVEDLAVFCGPNSCGKSNLFRALEFAFRPAEALTKEVIYHNMSASRRDTPGGPLLSIYIDLTFDGCPIQRVQSGRTWTTGETVEYKFRAVRTGTVTRKLGEMGPSKGDDRRGPPRGAAAVLPRPVRAAHPRPFSRRDGAVPRAARGGTQECAGLELSGPQRDARGAGGEGGTLLADHAPSSPARSTLTGW